MQLISTTHYVEELLKNIRTAQKRILVASMSFSVGTDMDRILAAMKEARLRGVAVGFLFDSYAKSRVAFHKPLSARTAQLIEETAQTIRDLEAVGVKIVHIGRVRKTNPFKGRFHIKIVVIDDISYSFGGINFSEDAFSNTDYMFKSTDPKTADELASIVHAGMENRIYQDRSVPLMNDTALLLDSGTKRRSIIYETACELAAKAQKIYYVSQMQPTGTLSRLLKETDTTCYFNRVITPAHKFHAAYIVDAALQPIRNHYRHARHIHAKYILFELKDGTRALVSGSNNFSWRGIAYGTKEIGISSTNAALWEQLYRFTDHEIA
jgi:hypothetical protein